MNAPLSTETEVALGEYAEGMPWKIERPFRSDMTTDAVGAPSYFQACKHIEFTSAPEPQYRSDESIWGYKRSYTLPAVAICKNEGGYNCTILCLSCLDEARHG